jgi:hypothetical protein
MRTVLSITAIPLFAVFVAACEMSDDDRCPGGMNYDPVNTVCKRCLADEVWDEATYDCVPAGDTDSATDGGTPVGMGESCDTDGDCDDYEADFCSVNPHSGVGYCTVRPCESGGCPTGYQCCDCTESTQPDSGVLCLNNDEAPLAESMGGCTCE